MKKVLLILILLIQFVGIVSAQDSSKEEQKEVYKKMFLEGCISEAKAQKLNVNAKSFCTCSFEKLFILLEESGADLSDSKAMDKISKSKEYENAIFGCLSGSDDTNEDAVEKEFVRICAKNMNKDKFMRKNTNANEICSCTYSKIKDGPYSIMELNKLSEEESSKYLGGISAECVKYYFESKGLSIE